MDPLTGKKFARSNTFVRFIEHWHGELSDLLLVHRAKIVGWGIFFPQRRRRGFARRQEACSLCRRCQDELTGIGDVIAMLFYHGGNEELYYAYFCD